MCVLVATAQEGAPKALNEEKIHEVWQEMLASGVQPNIATYQNAIEAYSRLGHIAMMEAPGHTLY